MSKFINKCLGVSVILIFVFCIIFNCVNKFKADVDYSYNSWYTFNSEPDLSDSVEGSINGMTKYVFTLKDSENVEHFSNTINYMKTYQNSLFYSIRIFDTFTNNYNSFDVEVYNTTNGWLNEEYRYIFVNTTSGGIGEFLENEGVWNFVYSSSPSSLSDLVYSVADVIPHTIQSMTSIEILGTTLFAILGTIVLILIILKIIGTLGG